MRSTLLNFYRAVSTARRTLSSSCEGSLLEEARSSFATTSAEVARCGELYPEHAPANRRPRRYFPRPEGFWRGPLDALSDYQRSALGMVREQAEKASAVSGEALSRKFKRSNLTPSDLVTVLNFFATTCPMTINFRVEREVPIKVGHPRLATPKTSVVEGLIKRGGFYSQFVTGISGGFYGPAHDSPRDTWEKIIFKSAYYGDDKDFPFPHQRPVYGGFNYLKKPNGACEIYGPAFATLKDEVKMRTTLCFGDSAGVAFEKMGTPDHMDHIILNICERDLPLLVRVASGQERLSDEELRGSRIYIECQIHGGVSLSDLSSISFPSDWLRDPKNRQKIQTLKETYGLTINSL